MARYAAFLRGINVGGRVVKMADLRVCLDKAGLHNVATLLQSGNVVFESDAAAADLKKLIEAALTKTFAYPAIVQVVPLERLRAIVDGYPFGTASSKQHDYVIFIENGLEKAILADDFELGRGEKVQTGRGVIYWRVDQGLTLRSSFGKTLAKAKYRNFNTNRNIKTLRKMLAI
ncbi:MAG TPA: DUF1697 domain-containing protein [Candidatus Saccharimonadales bacterium]|nr:DUF1697 domain-containing protein [Candidatus Saccharimonadales bacterium]